jgi:mevalonate pyrophosphate decarboxylase
MDAGPHVKALCGAKDVEHVAAALGQTQGVLRTIVADPGPGIEL